MLHSDGNGRARCPTSVPSHGFTLIELLVALTVGGIVLLMAHRMIGTVVDAVYTIEAAQQAHDRAANGRRLLNEWIGNIDVQVGDGMAFRGLPHELAFPTWAEDERAWPVRGPAQVTVEGHWLVGYVPHAGRVALWPNVDMLEIDYLLARGAREQWVRSWVSEASVPEALRLRVRKVDGPVDTLLLTIGARG